MMCYYNCNYMNYGPIVTLKVQETYARKSKKLNKNEQSTDWKYSMLFKNKLIPLAQTFQMPCTFLEQLMLMDTASWFYIYRKGRKRWHFQGIFVEWCLTKNRSAWLQEGMYNMERENCNIWTSVGQPVGVTDSEDGTCLPRG